MPYHLIRKLGRYAGLSTVDEEMLRQLARASGWVGPRSDLLREGAAPRDVCVILEGWACAYKQLEDGRRQIIAYLMPGDVCSMAAVFPDVINYTTGTLTSVRMAQMSGRALLTTMDRSPRILRAFWLDMLAASAIQREWTASLGFLTARERIAHLLCEIMTRLRAVGLADAEGCFLPLTQEDLGETVGISTVHVNRTLQDLRASGLITLKRQQLAIPDFAALQEVARFDGAYLRPAPTARDADHPASLRSILDPVLGSAVCP
ncbi:Crp/Fnr family transcriptional regulator [Methylobacterium currus]|uniref:Crp/Fnr family transcriptional regulator n=1 Tax=Methylobacterium currus TaxID=2051553 RepID=A0A2R4WMQ6_9HYPH|nr:Crp/Fnr family transcriptional regulator [Methylobacterium currus]AWB22818.1 Crp/Fnr family transcriptional regulator [Methylobacterium currus]UHC17585.1 Crp/Fnr family transcriptional regulator [Methylobacterium currus]